MAPSSRPTVDPPVGSGEEARLARAKEVATNFSILLTVTCILVLLLEVGSFLLLRFMSKLHPGVTPVNMQLAQKGQSWTGALAREWAPSGSYDYQPYVVWRHRRYRGETIFVDDEGLRRTYHSHCDGDQYTIWVFGGSTLWGAGSPDWGTIPSFLADLYEKAGQPACVRNFGEGGWVNTQEVIDLMLELKRARRKPDLVIFYDGVNEAFVSIQSGRVDVHMNFDYIKSQMESSAIQTSGGFRYWLNTNTGTLLRYLAERRVLPGTRRLRSEAIDSDSLARAAVANYLQNLELVEILGREYKFEAAFFWQPAIFAGKPLTGEERKIVSTQNALAPNLEAVWLAASNLIRAETRPQLYDIADVFDNLEGRVYLDWCHVTMDANRIVAARVYQALAQRGP